MDLRKDLAKARRDAAVEQASQLVHDNLQYIIEQGLAEQMHRIATGHIVNALGLQAELPDRAKKELDELYWLMGLRAIDQFTLRSQSAALAGMLDGKSGARFVSNPDFPRLLNEKMEAELEAEEAQRKLILAILAGEPTNALRAEKKKRASAVHGYTERINSLAGGSGAT